MMPRFSTISRRFLKPGLLRNSMISTVDQGMLSAFNFLISVILIKTIPKEEYGYYAIAFSVCLFLVSLQSAVVNTPLAVLLVSKTRKERHRYQSALLCGQFLGMLPICLLSIVLIYSVMSLWWNAVQQTIALAVSLAAFGLLYREYLRALFFAKHSPLKVLQLDGLYILGCGLMLMLLYHLMPVRAAGMIGISGIAGIIASLICSKKQNFSIVPDNIIESYTQNWKYGRWALLGVVVTHIESYSYLYIIGALIGSSSVAEVNASRLLIMPLAFIAMGWGKVVIPHGAKLREQGKIKQFYHQQILASIIFVAGLGVYQLVLLAFSDTLLRVVLSEEYKSAFAYVIYWGGLQAIGFVALNALNGLLVLKAFKGVSLINIVTMVITVLANLWLIPFFGIRGSLCAMILGGGISAVILWTYFTKTLIAFQQPSDDKYAKGVGCQERA